MLVNSDINLSSPTDTKILTNNGLMIIKSDKLFNTDNIQTGENAKVVCSDTKTITTKDGILLAKDALGTQIANHVIEALLPLENTSFSEDGYSWDSESKTLTLSGVCYIDDKNIDMLTLPKGANIELAANTTSVIMNNSFMNNYISAISGQDNFEINGNGTLYAILPGDGAESETVASTSSCVGYAIKNRYNDENKNNITIGKSGVPSINVISQDVGIMCDGDVTIDNGKLDIWGSSAGIDAKSLIINDGTVTVSAGKIVKAFGTSNLLNGRAIEVGGGGKLSVKGGNLTAIAIGYNGRGIDTGSSYVEFLNGYTYIYANGENGIGIDTNCISDDGYAITVKNYARVYITADNAAMIVKGYESVDSDKWLTKVMYDGVEVAGIWNISDVNRGDIPEVGTKKAYDVTFTPDNTDDYAIIKESVVPQIEKKSLEVLGVPELKGIYGDKVTDMELTGGKVEPTVEGEFTVTDKNKTDIPNVGTTKAYEVTFTPNDTNNYEVIKTLVTPVISKKTVVVENAPTLTGTYGDKLSELVIGNGTMIEDIEGEWTVTQNGSEAIYPVVGGTTSYEVSFIPKDNNYAPFKVNIVPIMEKKDIVIRIKDVTTVLGEKISKFDFDIIEGSLAANDTLESLNVKITTDADEASKVGKYKLLFESADNINYNVKAENDGVYEVVKKSEGITTKPTTKPPTTKPTTKPPTTKPTTESNNPANTGETNTISKVATGDVVPAGLILLLVGTVVIITIMQTKKTNKL